MNTDWKSDFDAKPMPGTGGASVLASRERRDARDVNNHRKPKRVKPNQPKLAKFKNQATVAFVRIGGHKD
jgi:hypothetical protein